MPEQDSAECGGAIVTVEDPDGTEKRMVGRPAGLKDFDIPTGDTDLDWRCPQCKEVGHYTRTGYRNPSCVNRECRVDRFSPFVETVDACGSDMEVSA